jgi:heme-degrading monooxygenase HmoA
MGGPFRVMLTVEVVSGREAEFEQAWREGSTLVTAQPANRGHWLARCSERPHTYYIFSDWIDEAHFREFERSDAHLAHRGKLHPYRSGGTFATMHLVASPEPAQ